MGYVGGVALSAADAASYGIADGTGVIALAVSSCAGNGISALFSLLIYFSVHV